MLDCIDPLSDIPHWRRLTKAEYDAIMTEHDDDREELCWTRVTEFFNRLIVASMEELPQHYRDNWLATSLWMVPSLPAPSAERVRTCAHTILSPVTMREDGTCVKATIRARRQP